MTQDAIHDVVRNRYGAIARATDEAAQKSTCCGPSAQSASCCAGSTDSAAGCGCSSGLYNAELLEGLLLDATALSLGCGGTQFT